MEKKYQVFVSSTYKDLEKERASIIEALLKADFFPVAMENFGAPGERQTEYIEKLLKQTDYYILILAGKYGSLNNDGIGYTEAEYDCAISCGIPIIPFVIRDENKLPRDKTEIDDDLHTKLAKFRKKVMANVLCVQYDYGDINKLSRDVLASLIKAVKENPRPGWVRTESESLGGNGMMLDVNRDIEDLMRHFQELTKSGGLLNEIYRGMSEKQIDYSNHWKDGTQKFDILLGETKKIYQCISYKISSSQLDSEIREMITSLSRAREIAEEYKTQYVQYENTGSPENINENLYSEYERIMFNAPDEYKKLGKHMHEILKK